MKRNKARRIVFWLLMLWCLTTVVVQMLKCPKMTNTEHILNAHNTIILNFKEC